MSAKFIIQYRCDAPGRSLARRLTTSYGVKCWAMSAARALGWDGRSRLTYFDSDGLALGGHVPALAQ